MPKYALSCSCGRMLHVETSQAGRDLTCKCGETVVVPSFRDIRKLPLVSSPAPIAASNWNLARGTVFSSSALIVIATSIFIGLQLQKWNSLDTANTLDAEDAAMSKVIDSLSYEQAFVVWTLLRDRGLGKQEVPQYMLNRREADRIMKQVYVAGGIFATALLCALATLVINPKPRKAGTPRKPRPAAGG